jgi:hypothetical protein
MSWRGGRLPTPTAGAAADHDPERDAGAAPDSDVVVAAGLAALLLAIECSVIRTAASKRRLANFKDHIGRDQTAKRERISMKSLLVAVFLVLSAPVHAGAGDVIDPESQLSQTLRAMEQNGHMQCLWHGIRDYYRRHVSIRNILQQCRIEDDKEIFAAIRTVIGVRDTDWSAWHCGPLGVFGLKCGYHGVEVVF